MMNDTSQQPDELHWACRHIGLPWQAEAKGPDIFDC